MGRVFKTMSEPHVGDVTLFRLYTGELRNGDEVWNAEHETAEKLNHLSIQQGKERIEVERLAAGDIGSVAKLKDTHTGDTFCRRDAPGAAAADPVPRLRGHLGGGGEAARRGGQAGRRAAQAARGRSRPSTSSTARSWARRSSTAWASGTSRPSSSGWSGSSACTPSWRARASPTARRSRARPRARASTRSRPAAGASTATAGSGSRPGRAARATSSSTRSSAA